MALTAAVLLVGCSKQTDPSRSDDTTTAETPPASDAAAGPKPAPSPADNVAGHVDWSQLGAECGGDLPECPPDRSCAHFASLSDAGISEFERGRGYCVPDPICSIVTCSEGSECSYGESYPAAVMCGPIFK